MLHRLLKDIDPGLFIYLCMERADVWKEALGIDLKDSEGLIGLFDERVKNLYGGTL